MIPKKPKVQEAVSRFKDDNDNDDVVAQLKNNICFEMSHAQPWGKAQLEGADFVRNLDITESEKELILHGNAERLYNMI